MGIHQREVGDPSIVSGNEVPFFDKSQGAPLELDLKSCTLTVLDKMANQAEIEVTSFQQHNDEFPGEYSLELETARARRDRIVEEINRRQMN